MLVLALDDLERLLAVADVAAAMSVEALLGTDRAFAADLIELRPQAGPGAERREPAPPARRLGDRRQPPQRRPRVQDAYSLRCAPQVNGAARDVRHARSDRRGRARGGDRQPDDPPRRAGRVVRELPRRAARARLRLRSRSRPPTSARSPSGTDRLLDPAAPSAAAVPRRRPRGGQRADARPVHAGGDGRREPPARRRRRASTRCRPARCRRTTSRWRGGRRASSSSRSRT